MTNFFAKIKRELLLLKSEIIEFVKNRRYVVTHKKDNSYQVYYKEKTDFKSKKELVLVLEEYKDFHELQEKELLGCHLLASYKDDETKSLYNLLEKDPWFFPSVHSLFILDNNELSSTSYGKKTGIIGNNILNLDEAKKIMIENVRNEQLKTIEDLYNEICNYLDIEISIFDKKLKLITKSDEKHNSFYNYGYSLMQREPTISMILLGVALECLLKQKYPLETRDDFTLGGNINLLKGVLSKEQRTNLSKINHFYNKAKHEKDFLVPEKIVLQMYQIGSIYF